MQKIKSLSDKRLIVQALLNGKPANFLLDTGATVGLIDKGVRKKYALEKGFDGVDMVATWVGAAVGVLLCLL